MSPSAQRRLLATILSLAAIPAAFATTPPPPASSAAPPSSTAKKPAKKSSPKGSSTAAASAASAAPASTALPFTVQGGPEPAPAPHTRNAAAEGAAAARVRAALCENLRAEGLGIRVEVEEDLATLTGRVASSASQAAATRVAKSIAGVRRVDNRLVPDLPGHASEADPKGAAAPEGEVHDRILEERVRASVLDALGIDGFRVAVAARDGSVTLSGSLPAASQVEKAVAAAKGTRGAKKVSAEKLAGGK